jgi:hypothetical protein
MPKDERIVELSTTTNSSYALSVFVATILFVSMSLVLAVAWINPYGYFGASGMFKLYNDRTAKFEHLREHQYEAYIMGSSNTMPFSPSIIEKMRGATAFNLGVYWGRAEDLYSWSKILLENENPPSLVVIGVEPWTFSMSDEGPPFFKGTRRRLLAETALAEKLPGYSTAKYRLSAVLDTFQWQTLEAALIGFLQNRGLRKEQARLIDSVFEADGTNKSYNKPATAFLPVEIVEYYDSNLKGLEVKKELIEKQYINNNTVESYMPGKKLNREKINLFSQMVADLVDSEVEIILIAMPVHPYFYDLLIERTNHEGNILEMRSYLESLSSNFEGSISFTDGSKISEFGGDAAEFHDHLHMTSANANRLLTKAMRESAK